jgi:type VI secretion system lysozyme-like protein
MNDSRKPPAKPGLVVPSLLDRLIGDRFITETAQTCERRAELMDVAEFRKTVLSDLEFLLNTVCAPLPEGAEELKQVPRSMASYGIPDLSAFSVNNIDHWSRIEERLLRTIEHHEPRLTSVHIKKKSVDELSRSVGLLVSAKLVVPPLDEPILIDAVLDLETLSCVIKEQS